MEDSNCAPAVLMGIATVLKNPSLGEQRSMPGSMELRWGLGIP